MKKGKYIDINILMACLSGKKRMEEIETIDDMLNKICTGNDTDSGDCAELYHEMPCTA